MKKIISLFVLMFVVMALAPSIARADVLPPPDYHAVVGCAKIVNLDQFPDLVLIGYTRVLSGDRTYYAKKIENNTCIQKEGYKFNAFDIYSITKDKFSTIDLNNLNLITGGTASWAYKIPIDLSLMFENFNTDVGAYLPSSDPLIKKTVEYSIIGNPSTGILSLYKSKQTSEYNNGVSAKVETFSNPNSTSTFYNFGTTTLRNGSRGEAVKELQRFLNANLNLGLVVDGILGPKTIAVIKTWQTNHGLVADGLVGKNTKAKMNSISTKMDEPKTGCLSTTAPWVKVLSPNGGETYTAGQQVTVNWESCNVNQLVGVTLVKTEIFSETVPPSVQVFLGNWVASNIGSEIVTIPETIPAGVRYKIRINTLSPLGGTSDIKDWSDDMFTINTPSTSVSTLSIDQLITNENLSSISCGGTASAEGESFSVTGYIYPSDASYLQTSTIKRINIRNNPNMSSTVFDVKFTSNINSIVNSITQKYNVNPSAWIHVTIQGILVGQDLPINGACFRGFSLETGNVVIN